MMWMRPLFLIASILLLTGCWNGENMNVRLGDVSLGQQLMDLKAALEAEAITQDEFDSIKENLIAINNLCERAETETSWF